MKELPSSRSLLRLLREEKKVVMYSGGIVLAALSIAIGTAIVPSNLVMPAVSANDKVIKQPPNVTAVVEDEAAKNENEVTTDAEVENDAAADAETENDAAADAEIEPEENVLVATAEVMPTTELVKFEETVKETDDSYIGQAEVEKENDEVIRPGVEGDISREEPEASEGQITLIGPMANQPDVMEMESVASKGTGNLVMPVATMRVTSNFGPRWGRLHRGTDFGMPMGSPIFAADRGKVVFVGYSGSYGNLVKIDHGNGMMTYYAHCSAFVAAVGQTVKQGEIIAEIGSTGRSTGPHLHFEVLINQANVDPMNYF